VPSELNTDDDDYGYGPDTSGAQESVSVSSHQESAVKIETMHCLDNPDKELSSLLTYRQSL